MRIDGGDEGGITSASKQANMIGTQHVKADSTLLNINENSRSNLADQCQI